MPRRQREGDSPVNVVLPGQQIAASGAPGFGVRAAGPQQVLLSTLLGTVKTGPANTAAGAGAGAGAESAAAAAAAVGTSIAPLRITMPQANAGGGGDSDGATNEEQQQQDNDDGSSATTATTADLLHYAAPTRGSTVLFRVTKVQQHGAAGPIVAIDGKWCAPTFRALVRSDDIRAATAKEIAQGLVPTHAGESYRLGDLVAAEVLTLAEARQYQVSTVPPRCGCVRVFSARATDGVYTRVPGAGLSRRDQILVVTETGATEVLQRWIPAANAAPDTVAGGAASATE